MSETDYRPPTPEGEKLNKDKQQETAVDTATRNNFSDRLRNFFTNPAQFQPKRKKLFCGGTAPMQEGNSEIWYILYATDFDEATLVDPAYVNPRALVWDMQEIQKIADNGGINLPHDVKLDPGGKLEVCFKQDGKDRKIIFLAGDATDEINMPADFNVYFSGRRVCVNDDIKKTPSDAIEKIVDRLPTGGFLVPDCDSDDDTKFFGGHLPQDLLLKEVVGIRPPPEVVKRMVFAVYDKLKIQYLNEAIAVGKISPRPIFEGVEYPTIDSFLESHSNFTKDDFVITDFGLSHKESEMVVEFAEFSVKETEIMVEMEKRCTKEATKDVIIRGAGLYQKVRE